MGDRTHETNEEDVVIPMVGYSEAMRALFRNFDSMRSSMKMEIVSGYHVSSDTND